MEIDNDVPVPKKRAGRRSRVADQLRQMRPGQSVYLDKTAAQGNMVANYAFGSGNYTVRKEGAGCRVWMLRDQDTGESVLESAPPDAGQLEL